VQDGFDRAFSASGLFHGFPKFAKLDFGEDPENVLLAFEIVEEGSLADIGGLGDVFDRHVGESALAE
jgi:hypothetical protein